jgi:anthraniloyl-CoA monooxygenase
MRVAVVGGGPGGLFLAILLRRADPTTEVDVFERNAPDDTFGFGVVFSQETLENITAADPESIRRIEARFRSWSAIDMTFRGRTMRSDGHAFAALARIELLRVLAERAAEVGARLHHRHPIGSLTELTGYDVVVAADGVNSLARRELGAQFEPEIETHRSKYIWLGTKRPFDVFTFLFVESPYGVFQAHVYPYDDEHATFIVETDPATWQRAGLDRNAASVEQRPGVSDEASTRFCAELFGEHLQGHALVGNNSKWLEFRTVRNATWTAQSAAGPVVLVGDAAHTAHFSIGSGTKLAMEDAIALADALRAHPGDVATALKAYEADRRAAVASVQRAAQTSLEWFESVSRYTSLEFEQFCFQLLTRSQRVTYDNLKLRDAGFVRQLDQWLARQARAQGLAVADGTPPMFYPYRLRGMELANRVVVSPMAQYCADDGVPNDWHLVHWGSRAVGGAGLVFTEMTCVSPEGRITPGCCGLWNDEQAEAFARVVDFTRRWTPAKLALQLGHSGRKGSTKRMWEGEDLPLDDGNWEVMAPSPIPYKPVNQTPREMSRDDMLRVVGEYVAAARRGADIGFDLLELHYAHGYLMSTFLSPLANVRRDEYGGSLDNRARFPLEVFDAVRAVWPDDRPISVRISATDWADGGFTGDDAVAFAALLKEHGCDIVDVSTGQVIADQKPRYGRLYQTPFADRIRHEVGMPTITVGAVASVDDANTIVMAGRADLCALARPHLVDPYWTLNASIDLGYTGHVWPPQYLSGRTARRREQHP